MFLIKFKDKAIRNPVLDKCSIVILQSSLKGSVENKDKQARKCSFYII